MKVSPFLIVLLVSSSCANREWDLPVPGFFEVVTEEAWNMCPGPKGMRVTIRNRKGSQTTGDDFIDYAVTFTHPAMAPLTVCAWKECEGKGGLLLPWTFLKDDDCPGSKLSLLACDADQEMMPGFRGHIWDYGTMADPNMLNGMLYNAVILGLDGATPATDATLACIMSPPRESPEHPQGWKFNLRRTAQTPQ